MKPPGPELGQLAGLIGGHTSGYSLRMQAQPSKAVVDPTVPCGPWDGTRLDAIDDGLALAFATHDLLNIPSDLWAAASVAACRRLATGASWSSLLPRERRSITVAVTRAVAQIILEALADGDRPGCITGEPAVALPELDEFTAILIAAGCSEAAVRFEVDEFGNMSSTPRPQSASIPLSDLLGGDDAWWDEQLSFRVSVRPGARPELELNGGISLSDPSEAYLRIQPNAAWLTDVWMTGRAANGGRILTRVDGPTAIATRCVLNSKWTGYHPERIQIGERDLAWRRWPPGAEQHLAITNEVWERLLAGDLDGAITEARRWGEYAEGTSFRAPHWSARQSFAKDLRTYWDSPGKARPPAPDIEWATVRAIYGWHCAVADWGLKTIGCLGRLIADGVSPLAVRAYAVLASETNVVVRTEHDLRIRGLLCPEALAATSDELVRNGLFVGPTGPLSMRARLATGSVLKEAAQGHGVKVSGTKRELVARLAAFAGTLEGVAEQAWRDSTAQRIADGTDPADGAWIVVPSSEARTFRRTG